MNTATVKSGPRVRFAFEIKVIVFAVTSPPNLANFEIQHVPTKPPANIRLVNRVTSRLFAWTLPMQASFHKFQVERRVRYRLKRIAELEERRRYS